MDIVFETRQEAVEFYRRMPSAYRQDVRVLLFNSRLAIFPETGTDWRTLSSLITKYIIGKYENGWLYNIIEKYYFFKDPGEKTAIMNIITAILAGEKNDLPRMETLPDRKQLIQEALEGVLTEHSTLSFASILHFRLTSYKRTLRRITELAIDEYKLEQEYQVFIDKLRRIIRAYKPLCEKIEVYDDEPFKIFDENHRLIRNVQSVRSFYPLLRQWGIDAEPSIILSLIALAPEQVVIFTDRPEHSIMKTLSTVFEDRVFFFPREVQTEHGAGLH